MARRGQEREDARALVRGWDTDAAADSTSAADGSPASYPAQDTPPRLARGPRRLLLLGLAAALVAALLIGLPRLLTDSAGPEEAAREVLQALVDSDLEVLREHVEEAEDASPAALREDVLAAADGQVTAFTVDEVRVDGDRAEVDATLTTAGATAEVTLPLTAMADGPFSRLDWQVGRVPLPEVLVPLPTGVTEVELNGVTLPVKDLVRQDDGFGQSIVMQLLPGRYSLTIPSTREHLEPIELELDAPPVLAPWRKPFSSQVHALDAAGEEQVIADAEQLVTECAAERPVDDLGCPFARPAREGTDPSPSAGVGADGATLPATGRGTWEILETPEVMVYPVDTYLWTLDVTGTARFTPAPGADGEEIVVPFVAEGSTVLHADGSLETLLHPIGSLSYAYCLDTENGAVLEVIVLDRLSPEEEFSSDACA